MSWHDCINPFGLPKHAHDFIIGNDYQTNLYANKLCPMCWFKAQRMVNNPQPITLTNQTAKVLKRCGPDTL